LKDLWYQKNHPNHPWLTPQAINLIETWLRPSDVGFEWGSGRSTLWFSKRVFHLTSIEHNSSWYEKVLQSLVHAKVENVDIQLRALDGGAKSDYILAIKQIPNEDLDFVLVDGRQRDLCILAALPKIRPGGLLILDNAERYIPKKALKRDEATLNKTKVTPITEWEIILERLSSWRTIRTTNGIWDTVFWVKT
jgi:predicted O-methyltransferase YrrM